MEALETSPTKPISALEVMSEEEREQVLYGWNETRVEYEREKCVHALFEEQVRRQPEAVAVVDEGRKLSYAELNGRANQLGHYLRKLGVKPETRVVICVEDRMELVVGLLGIWKAGGVYVPLDASYPVERLGYMIEDSAPAVLLTEGQVRKKLKGMGEGVQVVEVGKEGREWREQESETNLEAGEIGLSRKNGAYVIYTSGSTGMPKGVMVEHGGVVNLAHAQKEIYEVGERDRILQYFSCSFDVSVMVMVMTLSVGARLVLGEKEEMLPGPELIGLMEREGITVGVLPPVVLSHLPEAELPELREVIVGGEAWSEELWEKWGKGRRRFFNSYGPTETTVQATVGEYVGGEGKPSIGKAIRNVRVYVLDERGEAVPVGVRGELYIGGEGVGRGYMREQDDGGEVCAGSVQRREWSEDVPDWRLGEVEKGWKDRTGGTERRTDQDPRIPGGVGRDRGGAGRARRSEASGGGDAGVWSGRSRRRRRERREEAGGVCVGQCG